jgi:molybdopterin-biosynthesis enzyme MoeA-like protein
MLDDVTPRLKTGTPLTVEAIDALGLPEGAYAASLAAVAKSFPDVSIGSYPSYRDGTFHNQIVVRARNPAAVAEAKHTILEALAHLPGARIATV